MTDILLDARPACNTADDPAALVIHGPTWAEAHPWDEAAMRLKDELLKWNFKERRRGPLLHMMPEMLAEA